MHVHPQREEGKSKDWRVMEMCFTQIVCNVITFFITLPGQSRRVDDWGFAPLSVAAGRR
jgi:hypothetical protein